MRRPLTSRSAASEQGYVMMIVVVMLMIVLLLGAAGLAESLSQRSLSSHDMRERRAQQAAEAGVQRILYEEGESNIDNWNLNGGPLGLSTTLDCLPVTLNTNLQITGLATAYVNNAAVCPSTSGSTSYTDALGNQAFEQAEFIPGQTNPFGGAQRQYWPKIVSLGWDTSGPSTVYQREEVILKPIAPLQAIEGMGNVTLNGLSALGLGAVAVNGDVISRGTLTLPTVFVGVNLSTTLSGSILATVEAPTISGSLVSTVNGGTISQSSIPLRPPVTISSSKTNCPAGGCPSVTGVPNGSTDGYSSATDTLTMTHSSDSVTFQPGDYVFCNFNVTAGSITVNPSSSAPVRIFIDNPNSTRCKSNGLGSNQGNFIAAPGISNLLSPSSPTGTTTAPSGLQVYVAGDGGGYDNATTVSIGNTATCTARLLGVCTAASSLVQSMVIYAPTSSVTVNTGVCVVGALGSCTLGIGGTFDGAVIGDNMSITAGTITQDLDLGNYPLYDGVSVFRPAQYIECSNTITSLLGINDPSPTAADLTHDTSGC